MELKNTITIVSWSERKKYGCLGRYITNFDIYKRNKLIYNKGYVIDVIEYKDRNVWENQFITASYWFKCDQITPIE